MRWKIIIIGVLVLFGCGEQKSPVLFFVEKSLINDSISINLPTFHNGIPFYEEDSVEYLNIYLLDDSTVKLNDTVLFLPKHKSSGRRGFGMFRAINDTTKQKYLDSYILSRYLDNEVDLSHNEINLFLDTSIGYEMYYEVLLALIYNNYEGGRLLNLMDKSNKKIEVRFPYEWKKAHLYGCFITSNILEILHNADGMIMIENEWDKSFSDISTSVKLYYTNPDNSESLPRMDLFTEKLCITNIGILKAQKASEEELVTQNQLQKEIDKWEIIGIYTKLIGPFRKVSKTSYINIQLDARNSVRDYLIILDSVNGAVVSLRNELSIDKFHKSYTNLNPSDSVDRLRIEAIEFVYPTLVNPTFNFSYGLPPPPPPWVD